ncbi:hypothetical protein [Streptomyces candidus]|uniref:Uncharacterized protein n=1 Tax=Streptomyces candidus TaxID=67283 RepID=A0A7X0HKV9_9ACTN|nr:hypothetical protein [Streptomyces candidus]MBB6438214.1 hypothetical protein [Streptomyces candidus]GHH38893.1 hypothetical protein GCM10018773_17810 [Streptomyces candidus]
MGTHAAVRDAGRGAAGATRASWALPLFLGLVYGGYAAFMARGTGPLTGANVLFGVLCGLVLAALAYGVGRIGKVLDAGPRAFSYAVVFGSAMGFLHSLADGSVLGSVVLGPALGAAMLVATYYALSTRPVKPVRYHARALPSGRK